MEKQSKCLACKRTLIGRKIPMCSRCKKMGFQVAKNAGPYAVGLFMVAKTFGGNNNKNT